MKRAVNGKPWKHGERNCITCGKPHDAYYLSEVPSGGISWADPDDGHPYHPESWETVARRLGFERGA